MASFTDSNGLLLKEMNIQKRSINGSQVSVFTAISHACLDHCNVF